MDRIYKKNILIIGSGSGLGEQLSCQIKNCKIVSTYNKTKPNNKNNYLTKLDLENESSLLNFFSYLKNLNIIFDIIYFVGAHTPHYETDERHSTFSGCFSKKVFQRFLNINCFAPIYIFQQIYQNNLISENGKVLFFSSLAGSIKNRGKLKHNIKGGNQFYRISKSALNSGVKNIAYDLEDTDIKIVCLHPGWVKTNSGGVNADVEIGGAVKSIIEFTKKLNRSHHGGFYFADGNNIQW